MFYSKLRWKIKDLENELQEEKKSKENWRKAYDERLYESMFNKNEARSLKDMVANLKEEKMKLISEMETIKHDLDMAGQQFEAANEDIKRLQDENDMLRKKGGCPCDKRRIN